MEKLTNDEFKLLSAWTNRTHLDNVIDIIEGGTGNDSFYDFEENEYLSLKEGFEILGEAIAYSFQHEGFTDEEAHVLEQLFIKYTDLNGSYFDNLKRMDLAEMNKSAKAIAKEEAVRYHTINNNIQQNFEL